MYCLLLEVKTSWSGIGSPMRYSRRPSLVRTSSETSCARAASSAHAIPATAAINASPRIAVAIRIQHHRRPSKDDHPRNGRPSRCLTFLDGWLVCKVVPSVAVERGKSYSVGPRITTRQSLVQLCGGDPSQLLGMNFTTWPRSLVRGHHHTSPRTPFLDNFWFANNPGTIYTQGAQAAVKFLEFLHRPWKLNSNGGFLRYNGSNDSLRPSGLVNCIPAHNRADNLKVLDFLFVHREE